mmetsp:Transcript_108902/g.249883  ORF Transcript_108902/g.249883 Transcript_108902/m.249883 type:complete len:540 (-) Transcript_108902:85-1704(-)
MQVYDEDRGTMKIRYGWMQAIVYGGPGYGSNPKILSYKLPRLVTMGGLCSMLQKGTLCTMSWDAVIIMVFSVVLMVITTVLVLSVFEDTKLLPASHANYEEQTLVQMKQELELLNKYMSRVVPFMLGLYLSLCLGRWWMLRELAIGSVYDGVTNLGLLVGAYFPHDRHRKFRVKVRRYSSCAVRLLVCAARGEDWAACQAAIWRDDSEGQLTELEKDCLQKVAPYQRVMMIFGWILTLIVEAAHIDKIPPPNINAFHVQLLAARDGIQLIDTVLNTQLPFAYVHLIALLVNLNNIVVSLKCAFVLAVSWKMSDPLSVASQIMYIMVMPVLYHGCLSISYLIEDPFGEEILDFPILAFSEFVEANLASVDPVIHPAGLVALGLGQEHLHDSDEFWQGIFTEMKSADAPPSPRSVATGKMVHLGKQAEEIKMLLDEADTVVSAAEQRRGPLRVGPRGESLADVLRQQNELYREMTSAIKMSVVDGGSEDRTSRTTRVATGRRAIEAAARHAVEREALVIRPVRREESENSAGDLCTIGCGV